jgi:branched-chain amino acid transport system permease protein
MAVLPLATVQYVVQNVIDAVALGSLYALLALGLALLFGVLGLLNWAHGELIMVGGYAVVLLSGLFLPLIVLAMIGVVVLLALTMERVAFRPVRGARPETMLVTSFGISFLLQSVALMVFGSRPRSTTVSSSLLEPVTVAGISIPRLDLVTVGVAAACLVSLTLLLSRTRLGIQLRGAAQDFEMTMLLGVNANRVIAVAFGISGLLATAAAFLLVAQTGVVTPTFGANPVLIAFTAVIVGGMGSLVGGAVGGFVIGALSVLLQAILPTSLDPFRDAFLFGFVLIMLIARPEGLVVDRNRVTRV